MHVDVPLLLLCSTDEFIKQKSIDLREMNNETSEGELMILALKTRPLLLVGYKPVKEHLAL